MMGTSAKRTRFIRLTPAGVALIYAVFAALWIVASGYLLTIAVSDPLLQSRIELSKGLVFVAVTGLLLYLLLKGWYEPSRAARAADDAATAQGGDMASPGNFRLVPIFVALILLVPLFGLSIIKIYIPQEEQQAYRDLEVVAMLKAGQIESWLDERRGDSEVLASDDAFAERVARFLRQEQDAELHGLILKRFDKLRSNYGYTKILLFDAGGRLLLSSGEDVTSAPVLPSLLRQAIVSKQIQRRDIYRDEEGHIHLEWAVPLIVSGAQGKRAVAVAVLRVTAQRFIYPLIQNWPTASASAETLLVRRDGESVLYLNELRHRKDVPLTLRLPVSAPEVPAAVAVGANQPGTVRGADYRGTEVLAAYRPVAGTDWHIVAKIDRDEALKPMWEMMHWIAVTALAGIATIMVAMLLLWRQQQHAQRLALAARSAAATEESERRFRAIVQSANDAIITADSGGRVVGWNASAERMFGYAEAEIAGQSLIRLIPERFRSFYSAELARLEAGEKPRTIGKFMEFAGLRKDGSEFPLKLSLAQWETATGQFFTAIIRDTTERKQAETLLNIQLAEIRRARQEWQAVFDSIGYLIFLHDSEFRVVRANRAYAEQAGKSLEEIIGQPYYAIFPQSAAPMPCCLRAMGEAEEEEEVAFGKIIYRSRAFTVRGEQGEYLYSVHILEDITERKRAAEQQAMDFLHATELNKQLKEANRQLKQAQSQLLQSAKMASVGLLAAGVAHEINNPIGYVNSNLGTLEKYLADIFAVMDRFEGAEMLLGMLAEANDPLLEELRQFKEKINLDYIRKDTKALIAESHQGLERVKRIVLDLKNFSHADSEDQWMWADVHQLLDTTLNVVWNELKYKCEIVKEFGVLPKIYCLPSQLDQVFMNLLVNAAQAIGVRGTVTLRTGMEGEMVWVEVSDTGKGIPPEDFPHLFDPFFTTKPVGQGTGLGLSVSYSIVEKHHGKIEVHSEVGKGSVFRVWLPVQQPDTEEKA